MASVSQDQVKSASTATFVTAIVFNAAVFGIEIFAFTLLRPRFNAIYEHRSHVLDPAKRTSPISSGLFAWPLAVYRADFHDVYRANGLDAYFFVRFLRFLTVIFLPIWFLTWAVLLPLTSVNTVVGNNSGLDRFTFGNIDPKLNARYAAHVIIAFLSTGWVCYNIKKEMAHFLIRRQEHLIDPVHAKTVQANTVLITGIPLKLVTERALTRLFGHLPGGVKKIWINRNLKELPAVYDRRLDACSKLESAESALLRTAAKIRRKENKRKVPQPTVADAQPEEKTEAGDANLDADPERGALAERLVPAKKRPTHRLKLSFMPFSLPLIGQKVDTIEWAREEIRVCTELLEKGREVAESEDTADLDDDDADSGTKSKTKDQVQQTYPAHNSAFITFNEQIGAHIALQVLAHHEPYNMCGRWGEMSPQDVIWGNLGLNPYEQKVRLVISYALTAALILLWAGPVFLVGVISNVHAICKTLPFLAWICKLPPPVVGIISGILPPLMLVVLTMLLPIFLRLFAKFQGIPKKTGLELSLMTRFFLFQVLHSFLIVTISGGIIQGGSTFIKRPAQSLAEKLPVASTFFLTYMILQGLSGMAGGYLQIVSLIVYYVKLVLLGSTPRSVYEIKYGAQGVQWGTVFPGVTLLVVIALGYSLISPIMNGLACATFFGFYLLYKYLFLWVYELDATSDTGGLFYPKAMQHVFVGLYINQICMFALFLLSPERKKVLPEIVFMVILIFLTAFFHWLINDSYGPLINALPLTLAEKAAAGKHAPSSEEAGETDRNAEDEYGFAHPAISRPQRVVWIPRDPLGLARAEEEACKTLGVAASSEGAMTDEQGKVDVEGPPPAYRE